MITSETGKAVRHVAQASIVAGRDLAESLDRAGLLYTEERRKEAAVSALELLIRQLEEIPPFVIQKLGGGQPTVADGIRGTIEFIKMYRKGFD